MEARCYAMLYKFFFPCGSPAIFLGSPVFFPGSGLVLALGLGLGPQLSEPGCPDSVQGLAFFLGRILVLVRGPGRAVAWS